MRDENYIVDSIECLIKLYDGYVITDEMSESEKNHIIDNKKHTEKKLLELKSQAIKNHIFLKKSIIKEIDRICNK